MYFSVSSHRGRINEPGVEDAGEREGNIERVRQWRCCAFRSPPYSARNLPRGRPHRSRGRPSRADKLALRAPVSPRAHGMSPERAASALRVAFALQVLHGYLLLLAPRRPRL